jgi:cytoskeletal protein RodZ
VRASARFDRSVSVFFTGAFGRFDGVQSCDPQRARIDSIEMSQSVGEKLRLAREERGIALREISEQTRISMRYLEAIEADDYKHLPGGIFNRSFIRAYAKFIGFDEHAALEDYARTLRERGESDEDKQKTHHSLVYTEDAASNSHSGVKTLLLAIIILAALSAAV